MFKYVYSALLLVLTKPACDYVIRMVAKNTDAKVDNAKAALAEQLHKLLAKQIAAEGELEARIILVVEGVREAICNIADCVHKDREAASKNATKFEEFCETQIVEMHRLVSACQEEVAKNRAKKMSPIKNRDALSASELHKIQKDVVEVRRLVLENCTGNNEVTVLDSSELQKIQEDVQSAMSQIAELQKLVAVCQHEIVKSRNAAHEDALSLHEEHVQIHRSMKR